MLAAVALIEFLATLSSFPLRAEIVGQLLAAMAAVIAVQAGTYPRAARTANGYLIFFGLAALAWGVWQVVEDWSLIDGGLLVLEVVEGRVYLIDVIYEPLVVSHVTFYDYEVKWQQLGRVTSGAGYPARFFWEATYSGRLYIEVVGYSEGPYTVRITELLNAER